jgi:PAS domain S-box-containing protein
MVRELLEAIPQMVWTTDPQGVVEYLNERWTQYTGTKAETLRTLEWHGIVHPEDLPETAERWLRSLATGQPFEVEHRIVDANTAEYRWFLTRAVRLRDSQSTTIRWFGTSTDISEQKAARAIAESSATALAGANEELQHFAYAASHDIQAPLRSISIYSELLLRRLAPDADAATRSSLEFINVNARRLAGLLTELLTYAGLGRTAERFTELVDLTAVANNVTDALRPLLESHSASIGVDPLPLVSGSASQLAEVLQNLITNAVKYSRPGVPPRIRITAVQEEKFSRISVADNGQGFDPAYSEAIFKMFKRLHGTSVEGSGIGLALCRRVVERHGGRIWAESVEGRGSVFHFSVPTYVAQPESR